MRRAAWFLLLLLALPAYAQDLRVTVCYNYGCNAQGEVQFDRERLDRAEARLRAATGPGAEREALAAVIGEMYRIAGRQTPVSADRAGNFRDQERDGRMDCIDHSTNTTRFLSLIESEGMLRFHRVLPPARRTRLILQHFSAVIEEIEEIDVPAGLRPEPEVPDHVPLLLALCDCADVLNDIPEPEQVPEPERQPGGRFVIDSWFVDNGEAAIVLPLANWLDGEGPNVQ